MSAPTLGSDWRREIEALPKGWDNYRGEPISAAALDAVASFSVVPCSHGGVQIEVHRDGFDIEIEIAADGRISGVSTSTTTPTERSASKES